MNYRSFSIALVCVILGVILSWQYTSVYKNSKVGTEQKLRVDNLKDEILLEKKKNEDLRKKLDEIETQKREYEQSMGDKGLIEKNLKNELENARLVSGITDVKGKGIEILLDNNIGFVMDTDILNVINELKASGAQAICVNDERIVAMSEVRKAGNFILINGTQMSRPYVIRAISDPQKVESALKIVGGVVEGIKEAYNIKCTIEKKDDIMIPKIDSSIIKTNYLEIVK